MDRLIKVGDLVEKRDSGARYRVKPGRDGVWVRLERVWPLTGRKVYRKSVARLDKDYKLVESLDKSNTTKGTLEDEVRRLCEKVDAQFDHICRQERRICDLENSLKHLSNQVAWLRRYEEKPIIVDNPEVTD